ncbi:MAG: phosphoribosylanthranilate isomerase [Candidatus Helarchaeota archaeon]|nr:phosphoribosylanthranilate isomerase [Candidatus Helarchaeota archaeon]
MTKIKICGLRTLDDALFAHHAGADALGCVIDVPVNTPRNVTSQDAQSIISKLPPYALTVGVIMPSDIQSILRIIARTKVDALQIHGTCPAAMIRELKAINPIKIIKAFSIAMDTNVTATINEIGRYIKSGIGAILLDTKSEANAGGTGQTHDWKKSREIKESINCPLILAGGLTPENVADAIRVVEPYAVDVASGVESSPGIKDHQKIINFIENVRNS